MINPWDFYIIMLELANLLGTRQMQKWVAIVAYHGASYHGWQKQPSADSVQERVELALSKVADHPLDTVCAGRTDSGVHATSQVIHFVSKSARTSSQWWLGGNSYLPQSIRLIDVAPACDSFSARFSATARHYIYKIDPSKVSSPHRQGLVHWVGPGVDVGLLDAVGKSWLGEHDFSSFRDSQCQSHTPVRRLLFWDVKVVAGLIEIHVVANAFLHHMVRNMVGVALRVATKKRPISWGYEVLNKKDRRFADQTAAACGLYLHKVYYPNSVVQNIPILVGKGV